MLQTLIGRGGIRPDLIVGTSVGALNGAWLAGGSSDADLRELADLWRGLTRSAVFPTGLLTGFTGFVGLRNHLVSNRSIRRLLEQNLRFERMEDAPTPLHVIAADVLTGKDVRLSTGPSVDAVTASAALPRHPPTRGDRRPRADGRWGRQQHAHLPRDRTGGHDRVGAPPPDMRAHCRRSPEVPWVWDWSV